MMLAASERSELILLLVSAVLFLIGAVSALLALYLYLQRPKPSGMGSENIHWIGRGFDATEVAPRLQAVRRDYLNELRSRPQPCGHSPVAVAAARRMV